jgi:hypothetical protein
MKNIAPAGLDVLATPPITPFAVIPVAVIREQGISDAAFRLYAALDGRITETKSLRLRQDTLAADLGWSVSKVKRGMGELVAAGLVGSLRTSRSSRLNVLNPVRRTVDNLPGDRSDLSQQDTRSVNSDPADRSDLTPPQINNSLINNNNIVAGQIPTPTATGFSEENPIGGYLEAIAEAGVTLSATKTIQRLFGKIKTQGVTPAELTELVRRYLAAGINVANPTPYVAGYVLSELAAGRRPEAPKSAPNQMTPTELANASRCDHGAVAGQCALCRAASTLEQVKRIVAEVAPAAVFEHHNVFDPTENDYCDEYGEEIGFDYYGALIWVTLKGINSKHIVGVGISEREGEYTPAGGDSEVGYAFNIWEWKRRVSQRYSRSEAKHDETSVDNLRLEYVKPIDLATFAADIKWIVQQLDEITQRASNRWEHIAAVIPVDWQIKPNGNVAEVMQYGETIAHISVEDSAEQWRNITGMTLFTDYGNPSQGRNDWVLATARRRFKGTSLEKWGDVVTPVAVDGELAITIEPTRDSGLWVDRIFEAFQVLTRINKEIAQTDAHANAWLNSLPQTA